jgi:hypothetical protein
MEWHDKARHGNEMKGNANQGNNAWNGKAREGME